jgi:multidrug efflux pump subunit AcrA (membrane-fusion protein)
VEVWVQIKNPREQLKPGTSVQVSMVARTLPDAMTIPAAALLTAQDRSTSVMVVGACPKSDSKTQKTSPTDQCALPRPVKIGIRDNETDRVQIGEGLKEGDKIVASGAYGLPGNSKIVEAKPEAKPEGQDEKE